MPTAKKMGAKRGTRSAAASVKSAARARSGRGSATAKRTGSASRSARANGKSAAPKARTQKGARGSAKSGSTRTAANKKAASKRARDRRVSRSGVVTIDHEEIREWVEARGGHPASVKGTERDSEEAALLRIDFPDFSGEQSLQAIDWDEFFEKFEESKLAFLHDPKKNSRFNKLIARGKKRY